MGIVPGDQVPVGLFFSAEYVLHQVLKAVVDLLVVRADCLVDQHFDIRQFVYVEWPNCIEESVLGFEKTPRLMTRHSNGPAKFGRLATYCESGRLVHRPGLGVEEHLLVVRIGGHFRSLRLIQYHWHAGIGLIVYALTKWL